MVGSDKDDGSFVITAVVGKRSVGSGVADNGPVLDVTAVDDGVDESLGTVNRGPCVVCEMD